MSLQQAKKIASCKQVERDDPSPLLSTGEWNSESGVLCPGLISPTQDRCGHTGVGAVKGLEDN